MRTKNIIKSNGLDTVQTSKEQSCLLHKSSSYLSSDSVSMASMSLSLSCSILPSPILHTKPKPNTNLTTLVSVSASKTSVSASSTRKPAPAPKPPKVREFPQTLFFENLEKTRIKKKKKMKEETKSGKAWVHSLPEVLSYRIHKRHWSIALEVCHYHLLLQKKITLFFF